MDSFSGPARLRALIVGGALAVALAMPLAVSADTTGGSIPPAQAAGATITLGAVHFQSKVLATVDISFTCDPFQVYDWETGTWTTSTAGTGGEASAVIVEASGKTIATATGGTSFGAVTCDGASVSTLSIPVVASVSPFKAGVAAAGAFVSVSNDFGSNYDYASTGPIMVRLGK
jgi:hypothetical protein